MTQDTKPWTVVCDFDGTISTVDGTDVILEKFAHPSWLAVEADWKDGLIGSRECLGQQVALLDATSDQICALADTIQIDPHFKEFAAYCAYAGARLVVVSDGLDLVIERILAREGLAHLPLFSNAITSAGARRHKMVSPFADADCCTGAGTCKCAVISDLRDATGNGPVLFVGDGRSDFCAAARSADMVAAKSSLLKHLRSINRPCIEFGTFKDVKVLLADLLARNRRPVNAKEELVHERN
jgi:2-hydroxy-3-keto-5-methylthiopentenyl-1-phosphate phosphatase